MTDQEIINLLNFYADHIYKGYYVFKNDVETVLDTLTPEKVIEEYRNSTKEETPNENPK